MKKIKLTEAEKLSMSYDDVAYRILENRKKKIKIQDLFKEVIEALGLDESVFEEHLADFFELLTTDKRFIMLEQGYWDLKTNHKTKVVIEEDEEEKEEEINYDEEIIDDDETEDELKELVIIDENEENEIA